MSYADTKVEVKTILAGKLRRYHGVSLAKQLLDIPTTLRNIRDVALVAGGVVQSLIIIISWKPDVVFTKGGFVCLPVGIAAKLCRVPLVIHDSDAHPGLTNQILARWATFIATGSPLENYSYPESRSKYVGIPVDASFHPYSPEEQLAAKHALGMVDTSKPLVVVTGGGLGAKRINDAMTQVGQGLIDQGACIYHITGAGQFDFVQRNAPESVDYIIKSFVYENMQDVLGAADVVVTRAGATTLVELATLEKPTIIVPNPMLTGGHQTKNAAVYEKAHAALIVDESQSDHAEQLKDAILKIISDPNLSAQLSAAMKSFVKPDAALDVATLVVRAFETRHKQPEKVT